MHTSSPGTIHEYLSRNATYVKYMKSALEPGKTGIRCKNSYTALSQPDLGTIFNVLRKSVGKLCITITYPHT